MTDKNIDRWFWLLFIAFLTLMMFSCFVGGPVDTTGWEHM